MNTTTDSNSTGRRIAKTFLIYVLPGLAVPIVFMLVVWFSGRPHAGSSQDMRGVPDEVGLADMLRNFPASSVQWKNTDLITNVYVVSGKTEPDKAQEWAKMHQDQPAFKGLVEATEVVPAPVFHAHAPGEKLLYTGTITEPYKNTEIFVGERTAVFIMRQ